MYRFFSALLLCLTASTHAQTDQLASVDSTQQFGDYTVHYSVFNSTFVTPDIAKIYGLTRARNQALINISVTRTLAGQTTLGLPAEIEGTATNLLQQQRSLDFAEISETNATYFIAPLRHTNEETINFTISVKPEDAPLAFTVKFARKLYIESE